MGFQQSVGKFLLVDADYFWKFTDNAFDFSTLLNTTITFPISWAQFEARWRHGPREHHQPCTDFQAYWTFGHTRARYFFPENGGLIPQGTPLDGSVFRIDHDQAFQSTMNFRYQRPKNTEWIAFTYRFDSGLVVSGVPDATAALALTPNQQVTIGLACAGVFATVANPLSMCAGPVTSTLLRPARRRPAKTTTTISGARATAATSSMWDSARTTCFTRRVRSALSRRWKLPTSRIRWHCTTSFRRSAARTSLRRGRTARIGFTF